MRRIAAALWMAFCLAGPAAAQNSAPVAPLPASNYTTRALCELPAPGHVGCMALELVGRTTQAQAHTHPLGAGHRARQFVAGPAPATNLPAEGDYGYTPAEMQGAYGLLSTSAAAGQTIALVDAYNDPTAAEDLASYDTEFELPECTTANRCFTQLNEHGASEPLPFPKKSAELNRDPFHSS